jgi:hypothetical protein
MGLARSAAAAGRLRAAGVEAVRGDFTDPDGVGAAARTADGTISMATAYDPAVDPPAVDAILQALEGSGKPFIYTSGIWSHADTGGHVVDETTPPRSLPMVQWRQAVEDRVLAAGAAESRVASRNPPGTRVRRGWWEAARIAGPSSSWMTWRTSISARLHRRGSRSTSRLPVSARGRRSAGQPRGPDPLEDLERGSYVSRARRAVS